MKNEKANKLMATRSNEDLIRDWIVLDEVCNEKGVNEERAIVRGWLMDEIQKRWPAEFDKWIENSHIDDKVESYIKLN